MGFFISPPSLTEYGDSLILLHPELFTHLSFDGHKVMARTVTFQVTDDCCMKCTYCY